MFDLFDVLIDALWVLGLAGLLATFSYMSWYRGLQGWSWGYALSVPRMLFPLCLSLTIFCVGLALNGVTSFQPAPWWETTAWSILALLFAVQTVIYGVAGLRHGWDTPLEKRDHDE
ncbi:MAG: hypothetical protein HC802_15225 [Caldilineaceae bacterium]|nr:hypothetical protein [Caldilineaceae bacterium]